jgi:hypothetical protein
MQKHAIEFEQGATATRPNGGDQIGWLPMVFRQHRNHWA